MIDTVVTMTGNVATDVKYVRSDRGTALASFRLASTARRYDRAQGSWVDGHTTFLTVVCWRALAENAATSVHKGDPVVVVGRLRVEAWERDGRSGTAVEVDAQALGHDLARGTSAFRRSRREQDGAPGADLGGSLAPGRAGDDLADDHDHDLGTSAAAPGAPPTRPQEPAPSPHGAASSPAAGADGRAA